MKVRISAVRHSQTIERVSSIFTCEGAYISSASQPNNQSMNPERVSSIFTCEGAYIRRASQPNERVSSIFTCEGAYMNHRESIFNIYL